MIVDLLYLALIAWFWDDTKPGTWQRYFLIVMLVANIGFLPIDLARAELW